MVLTLTFLKMSEKFDATDATSASQLHKVLAGTRYVPNDTTMRIEDIVNYNSIDNLFGNRYYKILFLTGADEIGHWVLLTHLRDRDLEYFDSFGLEPPAILHQWCAAVGVEDLSFSTKRLQHPESYNCGRFVLARISSQPTELAVFLNILSSSKHFTPDDIVGSLFNVDNI